MGKKSRRIRTKPGASGSNAQSEETELVTIYLKIGKLSQKQKWEEILNLESQFLEAVELDKHGNNLKLKPCTVIIACIEMARAYQHGKNNFDSAMKHYRMGLSLVDYHSAELLLTDSEKDAFYILCENGIMYCLKELARPGWLGQSMDILKQRIEKFPQEKISPTVVLITACSLVKEGKYNDVYDILTSMLDTIANKWDDEYKAGAYAALFIACSDQEIIVDENLDQEKEEQAAVFLGNMMSYLPFSNDWRAKLFAHAGKYYLRDFQHDKAIFMFEKMVLFGAPQSSKNIYIGNVLLNKGNTDIEAIERFELALKILEEDYEANCGVGYCRFVNYQAHLGTGKAYSNIEMWSKAHHHLKNAYDIIKGHDEQNAASFHIEKILVDQYCTDEQLLHSSEEKRMEFLHTALGYLLNTLSTLEEDEDSDYTTYSYQLKESTHKIFDDDISVSEICPSRVYLYHAQLHYFLGKLQDANIFLIKYFEEMLKDKMQHCQSCLRHRSEAIGEAIDVHDCTKCKVACYCSEQHFKLDWNRGRLGHNKLCPFLGRWRLVAKKKLKKIYKKYAVHDDSIEQICSDFFESICGPVFDKIGER